MIVLLVRHAFLNNSLQYSSKLLREMTKFKVLTERNSNGNSNSLLGYHLQTKRFLKHDIYNKLG